MGLIWSHHQEVDIHRSTIVDTPDECYIVLLDGRRIPAVKTPNGLRWIRLTTLPSERSMCMAIFASLSAHADPPPDHQVAVDWLLDHAFSDADGNHACAASDGTLAFVSGVGKPRIALTDIQLLHLWHARLGHPSFPILIKTLATLRVLSKQISKQAIRTFAETTCDICK